MTATFNVITVFLQFITVIFFHFNSNSPHYLQFKLSFTNSTDVSQQMLMLFTIIKVNNNFNWHSTVNFERI